MSESLKLIYEKTQEKNYLPIDGLPEFKKNIANLIFGENFSSLNIATFQSLGGTGALKIGADFLKSIFPENEVYIFLILPGLTTMVFFLVVDLRSINTPITLHQLIILILKICVHISII